MEWSEERLGQIWRGTSVAEEVLDNLHDIAGMFR
jgi:hypothetical protein